ncbi:unnamed protein product, partial [Oikopleura dioica]
QSIFRGGTPYSQCRKWNDVLTAIDNGEKLHRPATMSRTVYDIIVTCFEEIPEKRAKYDQLENAFRTYFNETMVPLTDEIPLIFDDHMLQI